MRTSSYRYAGCDNVLKNGQSVTSSAEQIRRFQYLEERLMFLMAAHHPSIPYRDLKMLLGRLQYEDSLHADMLRNRLPELRMPRGKLKTAPDESLEILMNEAEHSRNAPELLSALVRVIKPALISAYEDYLKDCNPLADSPTVRIFKIILMEEKEHMELLQKAYEDLVQTQTDRDAADTWAQQLQLCLKNAGGVRGLAEKNPSSPNRSIQPYKIPHKLSRDSQLDRVWDYDAPPQEEIGRHTAYLIGLRLSEVNVSEGLAIVLCEVKDKPWEFYRDLSRHLWDEVRHSLFGEAALEHLCSNRNGVPMRDYEGIYCMEADAMEQYATLGIEVEGANMKYPIGKRGEWEFFKDKAKYPLMTTFQDYDWADEVLHVNIARRRLESWFVGSVEELSEFAAAGKKHRTEVKKRGIPGSLPDLTDKLMSRGVISPSEA